MRFVPRPIPEEVNVSGDHPLKEFLVLAGGILGILLLLYALLGAAVDMVVPRIGPELEEHLGTVMLPAVVEEGDRHPAERKLQELLDRIVAVMEEPERNYRIHLAPSTKANAMALPGGHIVVLSGLIREAQSENELAMVIGHELGHFRNRDHLRGLGRGLVLVAFSSFLFGTDSSVSRLASSLLSGAEMRFSQRQELAADAWGLRLVTALYGHAGGATDFFRRLAQKERGRELSYLFASHPFPRERIEALEERIRSQGYPVEEALPLGDSYLDGVSP